MRDNLGWILLAGGVVLLIMSSQRRQQAVPVGAGGGSAQPPVPPGGGQQPVSGGQQEVSDPCAAARAAGVMPESVGEHPPSDVMEQAALDPSKASLTGEFRLSWHGWNYYRAQAAIKAGLCDPPCSEYAPVLGERFCLTDSQGLTASEYHRYLSMIGMSGVATAWRRTPAYRRPWA